MTVDKDFIQKLIDGELSDTERVACIRQIDMKHPHLWRSIGLGAIEATLLRRALMDGNSDDAEKRSLVKKSSFRKRYQPLAAVALLLLGIGLGMFFSNGPSRDLSQVVAAKSATPTEETRQILLRFTDPVRRDQTSGFQMIDDPHQAREAFVRSLSFMENLGGEYDNEGYNPSRFSGYVTASLNEKDLIIPITHVSIPKNKK